MEPYDVIVNQPVVIDNVSVTVLPENCNINGRNRSTCVGDITGLPKSYMYFCRRNENI